MILFQFLLLLTFHWAADFVFQTHWQASNKSRRLDALTYHVMTYTAVMAVVSVALFGAIGSPYAAVNGILHFATDYFTSRWTAKLYARQDWHNFFVVVGLDQLIHQLTLAATLLIVLP
jgi:hypothetical protein